MVKESRREVKLGLIQSPRHGQRGTVIVYVAILIIVLLGFAALAVDMGHLYGARNELQNAADAGALAGAQHLYVQDNTGTPDPTAAKQFAYNGAVSNTSQKLAVEVDLADGDVLIGHWSFQEKRFYEIAAPSPPVLWGRTTQVLDSDTTFLNAVYVRTKRVGTPVSNFFAKIWGAYTSPVMAEAVAYIGFAGTEEPYTFKVPLAICLQAITDTNRNYSCVAAREIDSGNNPGSHNTGAWTNFTQEDSPYTPSCGPFRPGQDGSLICGEGNPYPVIFGLNTGVTNGMQGGGTHGDSTWANFYQCWLNNSANGTKPWPLTLPVIDCCPGDPTCTTITINAPCGNPVVGAVDVNVLWVEPSTGQFTYPRQMGDDWTCPTGSGPQCWLPFATNFKIKTYGSETIITEPKQKSIYLAPDCNYHQPTGNTGGRNFGILAKIPVLVAPPLVEVIRAQ